mmetsp:Transcript_124792/g.399876  ORF Transcript_124792/g.399876 Transcript_124792/m.399876 type:complete len:275 (-) Transcript_124792:684-1508(-)
MEGVPGRLRRGGAGRRHEDDLGRYLWLHGTRDIRPGGQPKVGPLRHRRFPALRGHGPGAEQLPPEPAPAAVPRRLRRHRLGARGGVARRVARRLARARARRPLQLGNRGPALPPRRVVATGRGCCRSCRPFCSRCRGAGREAEGAGRRRGAASGVDCQGAAHRLRLEGAAAAALAHERPARRLLRRGLDGLRRLLDGRCALCRRSDHGVVQRSFLGRRWLAAERELRAMAPRSLRAHDRPAALELRPHRGEGFDDGGEDGGLEMWLGDQHGGQR